MNADTATIAIAHDLVRTGSQVTGIALTERLEHYLSITIARFMRQPERQAGLGAGIGDQLTVRVTRAMDENAPLPALRALADECLIVCAFFERRLRHHGGSLRHYVGLGQATYEAANLIEQAYGFVHMRDVVHHGVTRGEEPKLIGGGRNPRHILDAARAGSVLAREELKQKNVVIFPGAKASGLIWN